MSVDQRIRGGLRAANDQVPVPDVEQALARVSAGARKARRRTVAVALTAAAAAVTTIAGVIAVSHDGHDAQPVGPSGPSVTNTGAREGGPVSGTGQGLTPTRPPCEGCALPGYWIGHDAGTGRALWSYYDLTDTRGWNPLAGLAVVGPDDELASLSCADDLACSSVGGPWTSAAALGPGADEVTIRSGDHAVRVIDYDGSIRQTLDIPGLATDEEVEAVAWSPDRTRLAVQAGVMAHSNRIRILVFDREEGFSTLVHTTARRSGVPHVLGLAWSPDGTRLGLVESIELGSGSTNLVIVRVPDAGQEGPGAATTVYSWERTWASPPLEGLEAGEWFAWSPDSSRVAVGAPEALLELSADDGRLLARHAAIRGPLIWPREPS